MADSSFTGKFKEDDKVTIVADHRGHGWEMGTECEVSGIDTDDGDYYVIPLDKKSGGYWIWETDIDFTSKSRKHTGSKRRRTAKSSSLKVNSIQM